MFIASEQMVMYHENPDGFKNPMVHHHSSLNPPFGEDQIVKLMSTAGMLMSLMSIPAGLHRCFFLYGGFLKWWVSPTTMGFPTKNQHFGVFWGGHHHLKKHPYGTQGVDT